MFTKPKNQSTALQAVIDRKLLDVIEKEPESKEFADATDQIVKLHKLKSTEDQRVTPDVLVSAAASIFGILLIINHEHVGPITTKALGFVPKPK